jgi:hypothetical protein
MIPMMNDSKDEDLALLLKYHDVLQWFFHISYSDNGESILVTGGLH